MIQKNPIKPVVGIVCVAALVVAVVVALFLDSRSPNPILGIFKEDSSTEQEAEENEENSEKTEESGNTEKETETSAEEGAEDPEEEENADPESEDSSEEDTEEEDTGETTEKEETNEETVEPPEDLPPTIVIHPETDPETGEPTGIQIPCQIPGYGLTIEKLAPYQGMFVEDGTNAAVQNVAMLMVQNHGNYPIEYTQICVEYGQEQLIFDISALPVGEKMVVQEKSGKIIPEEPASLATALVVQRADMEMSENQVQVTDNGDNTLTIRNLTDTMIPTVRVFYKYYMKEEDIFVGGIAFTSRVTRLGANSAITIQPSHYNSQTSRVIMVLTYDSEV